MMARLALPDRRVADLRVLGAVLLLAGGAIHTWLAFDGYGTAVLETAFFLNGVASAVAAAVVVLLAGRLGPLAGLGVSAGSLAAFVLSRVGPGVLGFRATGLDPAPEALATLVVEAAALAVLAIVLAVLLANERQGRSAGG